MKNQTSHFREITFNQKGQATVELAIILPIILLLIMIIIYAGIFTFSKSAVLLATHEGGREGLMIWNTDKTQEEKEEHIRKQIADSLSVLPNGEESTIYVNDDQKGGLTINVTYYFKLNLPFLKDITGYDAIPLPTKAIYRYTRNASESEDE